MRLHLACWGVMAAPLVYLSVQLGLLLTGRSNDLGADPGESIMALLGTFALWALLATLSITPLRGWFPRLTPLVRSRRMIGLWVFAYAVLHIVAYLVLVLGLDFEILWDDVSQKPYAIAGLIALLALVPLVVTSTRGWQRRLGRRWKKLHQLTYGVVLVGWIHYVWQVRVDYTQAMVYLAFIALLLAYRTPVKRFFHLAKN